LGAVKRAVDRRGLGLYDGARAQVAELVDAPASGAGGFTAVKVRVLSWAPLLFFNRDTASSDPATGCEAICAAVFGYGVRGSE
jgi:hypothetical protein